MNLHPLAKNYTIIITLLLFQWSAAAQSENSCEAIASPAFGTALYSNSPQGTPVPKWRIVSGPSPYLNNSTAWIIDPHPTWDEFDNAKWISPFPALHKAPANPEEPFVFEYCFCVEQGGPHPITVKSPLHLEILADDWVSEIRFNNMVIASPASPPPSTAQLENRLLIDIKVPVSVGQNCLQIDLYNLAGNTPTGLSVEGSLNIPITSHTDYLYLLDPSCCEIESLGSICGMKFHDANQNGNFDQGEQGVAGWQFTKGGPPFQLATADDYGYYCFENVPAGTYTVSEIVTTGSTPTTPVDVFVTKTATEFVAVNFGNSFFHLKPGDNDDANNLIRPGHDKNFWEMDIPNKGEYKILLSDISGRILFHEKKNLEKGKNEIYLSTAEYGPGIYYLTVSGNGHQETKKVYFSK